MTKSILLSLLVGTTLAVPAMAQTINKGVAGSPHDFSAATWNTRRGTCTPCHQAHHTADSQIAPLWAHATSTATFTPYNSPTMTAVDRGTMPSGVSLACLSCHDGTVAINQGVSGSLIGTTASFVDPGAQIGPDLHTTHPVSFTYDASMAAADGGLENPDTYKIGDPKPLLTHNIAPVPTSWSGTSLTGKTIKEAMLVGNKMECSSCHDVHKLEGSAPSSGILARISGSDSTGKGSLLCRTCHIK